MNRDDEFKQLVPADIRHELEKLLESSLSFREKWEIMKENANATGRIRMAIADLLIEEGLMKKRFSKRR